MLNSIPIIDLFAGPGGLGEGFSSVLKKNKRVFDIKVSIEKNENAHKTLEFRSFFRQFEVDKIPNEYYDVLRESNLVKREILKRELFELYPKEYKIAKQEAWQVELGAKEFPPELIDERIKKNLKKKRIGS